MNRRPNAAKISLVVATLLLVAIAGGVGGALLARDAARTTVEAEAPQPFHLGARDIGDLFPPAR